MIWKARIYRIAAASSMLILAIEALGAGKKW
jgi:hypothetical protein